METIILLFSYLYILNSWEFFRSKINKFTGCSETDHIISVYINSNECMFLQNSGVLSPVVAINNLFSCFITIFSAEIDWKLPVVAAKACCNTLSAITECD